MSWLKSWTKWLFVAIVTIGFILFIYASNITLYDSNISNSTVNLIGWTGIILFIGGIILYFILYAYKALTKRPDPTT